MCLEQRPVDDEQAYLVLTTCPDQACANALARAVIEEELATCVNQIPGPIKSIYRWQGEVCRNLEFLLLIKTTARGWPALRDRIGALHPYDIPELIALPIEAGSDAYLAWLRASGGAEK